MYTVLYVFRHGVCCCTCSWHVSGACRRAVRTCGVYVCGKARFMPPQAMRSGIVASRGWRFLGWGAAVAFFWSASRGRGEPPVGGLVYYWGHCSYMLGRQAGCIGCNGMICVSCPLGVAHVSFVWGRCGGGVVVVRGGDRSFIAVGRLGQQQAGSAVHCSASIHRSCGLDMILVSRSQISSFKFQGFSPAHAH